jgi:hypothetical protein
MGNRTTPFVTHHSRDMDIQCRQDIAAGAYNMDSMVIQSKNKPGPVKGF